MEFVINEPESDESIHIEQVDHGKFVRISSTSLLLNMGAFGPALKAGSPVTGSVTNLTRWERFLRGVNTIRPSSILASRGSPGRISSRRRSGPGRTTCPLVDTLVCVVRQSYPYVFVFAMSADGYCRLIGRRPYRQSVRAHTESAGQRAGIWHTTRTRSARRIRQTQ
jgi:hypothetical protein